MTDVLQTNIFFIIASVATVIFCLLVSLVLFQIYKIVTLFRSILERLDTASALMAEDAADIRQFLTRGGIFATITRLFMGQRARRKRRDREEDEA
jgi:hypothetical protein